MNHPKEDFSQPHDAFVSYKHLDKKFAKKLTDTLQGYKPKGIEDLPQRRLRIFRDEEDGAGGMLKETIQENLLGSRKLIVVCSPNALKSAWIPQEIELFLTKRNARDIIPVLIDGIPTCNPKPGEKNRAAFIPELCDVFEPDEPWAIDFSTGWQENKLNRAPFEDSWIKLLGSLYGKTPDEMGIRERARRLRQARRRTTFWSSISAILALLLVFLAFSVREMIGLSRYNENYGRAVLMEERAGQAVQERSREGYQKAWLYTLAALSQDLRAPGATNWQWPRTVLGWFGVPESMLKTSTGALRRSQERLKRGIVARGAGVEHLLWTTPAQDGRVRALTRGPGPSSFVTGDESGTVSLWDLTTGIRTRAWRLTNRPISGVAVAGETGLFTAAFADSVRIWSAEAAEGPNSTISLGENATAVAISNDGRILAAGREDGVLQTAAISPDGTISELMAVQGNHAVSALAVSKNAVLAFARDEDDGRTGLYVGSADAETPAPGSPLLQISGAGRLSLSFTGGALHAAALTAAGLRSISINAGTGSILSDTTVAIPANAFRPSTQVAVFDSLLAGLTSSGGIAVFDASRQMLFAQTTGHRGSIQDASLAGADRFATAGSDSVLLVWNRNTGAELLREKLEALPTVLAAGPHGRRLIAGMTNGETRFWSMTDFARSAIFTGGRSGVSAMALAPGDSLLATGSARGAIRIWDVAAGRLLRVLRGHSQAVNGLAFSRSGTQLASVSADSTVRLWNVDAGKTALRWYGHADVIWSVAFGENGLLATGSRDETVRLWDIGGLREVAVDTTNILWPLEDGKDCNLPERLQTAVADCSPVAGVELVRIPVRSPMMRTFRGHVDDVRRLRFSTDGRFLISASEDETVRVWLARTGTELTVLSGHTGAVTALSVDSSDAVLISGSQDGTAKLWDFASIAADSSIRFSDQPIRALALAGDGMRFAFSGPDSTVHHFKIGPQLGYERVAFPTKWRREILQSVAFRPGTSQLAYGGVDDQLRLWDYGAQRVIALPGHRGDGLALAFSPDGRYLASGSSDRVVRAWDLAGDPDSLGNRMPFWESPETLYGDKVRSVAFSPVQHDGKTLLASAGGHNDKSVHLWKLGEAMPVRTLSGHIDGVWGVRFSPSGHLLASASWDGTIRLWDVRTGNKKATLRSFSGPVLSVAFVSDSLLVSGSYDGSVRLWHVDTGREADVLRLHKAPVYGVAAAPDGRFLITVSADRSARLTDLRPDRSSADAMDRQAFALALGAYQQLFAFELQGTASSTPRLEEVGPTRFLSPRSDGAYPAAFYLHTPRDLSIDALTWLQSGTRAAEQAMEQLTAK